MVSPSPDTAEQVITFSISTPASLLSELKQKHPRWGDRSKVLRKLIEMYLRGDVAVELRKM